VVVIVIEKIFFFENAQFLLSSAALLKTKIEGVWMFLRKKNLRARFCFLFKIETSFFLKLLKNGVRLSLKVFDDLGKTVPPFLLI